MRAQEIGAENWDIQSGTQILDTCRRRKLVEEPILEDLTRWFQNTLDRLDMTHIQYQGGTLPPSPGISVSPGIR